MAQTQEVASELEVVFEHPGRQTANAVRPLPGGGFVVVGYTDGEGAGGFDVLLVRTDAEGEPVWRETYGGEGGSWLIRYSEEAGDYDGVVLHVGPQGELVERRALRRPGNDRGVHITRRPEGGWIAAGKRGGATEDFWLFSGSN